MPTEQQKAYVREDMVGTKNVRYKHGMSNTRIFHIWRSMLQRCENPKNRAYHRYGGRGIKVCERWHEFTNFYNEMGTPKEGMSLDRRDNDGDYTPENTRWATKKEQAQNTAINRMITFNGETKCLAEWASEYDLNPQTLASRLDMGIDIKSALTMKKYAKRKRQG